MFCKTKNDRNSSSEGPSVANINFGDVNETEFCNEPVAILNEETVRVKYPFFEDLLDLTNHN